MKQKKQFITIFAGSSRKVRLQRDNEGYLVIDRRMRIYMSPWDMIERVMGDLVIRLRQDPVDNELDLSVLGEMRIDQVEVLLHGKWLVSASFGPDDSTHHIQIVRGAEKLDIALQYNYGHQGRPPHFYCLEPVVKEEAIAPAAQLPARQPIPPLPGVCPAQHMPAR